MPSSNFNTQTDFSTQVKQYSGTTATLSGTTNILGTLQVKSVEIDPSSPSVGNVLIYDGSKFKAASSDAYSDTILNGMILSYFTGLTYNVSSGRYRISNVLYEYTGGSVTISSGNSVYARFDNVYVTGGTINTFVKSGTPSVTPIIPGLFNGQLSVGIINVLVNFTGGTGSSISQITSNTVFDYYPGGTGIQRAVAYNAEAIGQYSFAPSRESKAIGQDSIAMGLGAKASGNSQTVVGQYNNPNTTDYFIVGNGTSDGSRANAFRVTTSGSSYVQNKLFVTNIEVETTGASNGQVLKFNGSKFTPQLETITGLTLFSGGTNFISSITSNSLLVKALTGGTGITITESNGLISIGLNFSGTNAVTDIVSLTGGTSIISGKTGSTYFLYPLQGSGATSVNLINGKLIIYSDSSTSPSTSTITGSTNATGGIGVLGSVSNKNIVGRALTGTNRVTITQATDLITINSPIEVDTGNEGALSIYRTSSPIVYSSYTSSNNSGITVKLGTHTTPITSRTYTIPDVKKDANFVMTEGNQTINGKKEFISGITIGNDPQTSLNEFDQQFNHNIYNLFQPNDSKLDFFETISGVSYISEKIYADAGTKLLAESISGLSILKNSYYQSVLDSHVSGTVVSNLENIYVDSNGYDTNIVGKYNIYNFYDNPSSNYNSKLVGNYFESRVKTAFVAQTIESFKTIQLGYFNSVYANSPIKKAYDIYITKPLVDGTEPLGGPFSAPLIGSFASIYIEGKTTLPNPDVFKRNIKQSANTSFTYAPWSLFAESDRAYIGSTLVLASGVTLSSTTRGAWLDIGESQTTRPHINFSAGTDPTSPQSGDLWWNGNQLYFRSGSTSINLLSGGTGSSSTGSTSGLTTGTNLGDGVKVLFSSNTTNLAFATLSSQTPNTLRIISSSTGVILFSATTTDGGGGGLLYGTATNGGTDTYTATTDGTVTSYQEGDSYIIKFADNNIGNSKIDINGVGPDARIYKEINTPLENDDIIGGKIYLITFDGTDFQLVSFNEGGGTGSTVSGNFLPLSGGTLTGGLSATTISATSIDRINYIDFNTGATVTSQTARLNWNDTDGTLDLGLKGGNVTLQIGQEQLVRVVNKTGANLLESEYKIVRIRKQSEGGTAGQRLAIVLAQANNDNNSVDTLGIVTENINNNQEGFITSGGLVRGINTTGSLQSETWLDGDVLYLSPTTAGQLTNIKPQAPNHTVIAGYVVYSHINQGKIFVKIDNGYELDELHNVRIANPSNYNILTYDAVTYSSWTNSTLNEALSKTLLTANIPVTSQAAQVNTFYLYDKITITSATSSEIVTAITSNAGISAYTPSIKFFAQTGVTVTFQNSATLKTEGGLDAIIVGSNYDSITFTYNNDIGRYFQTNINNYI